MLLDNYHIKVESMWLLQLHPDLERYAFLQLAPMIDQCREMLRVLAAHASGGCTARDHSNHCLANSIRRHGVSLQVMEDGPFWALADGNRFLAPYGLQLAHVPARPLSVGRYVMWQRRRDGGHFVAVFGGPSLTAVDDDGEPQDFQLRVYGCVLRVYTSA